MSPALLKEPIPDGFNFRRGSDDFKAILTGVAGASNPDVRALEIKSGGFIFL